MPHLSHSPHPAIVNISSAAGINGSPMLAGYSMSKAAVIRMTEALSVELRPAAIRCNAICPALTGPTRMVDALVAPFAAIDQRSPLSHRRRPDGVDVVMAGQLRSGRVASVTGAGSGIGAAVCALFRAQGATVIGADVDKAAPQADGHPGRECAAADSLWQRRSPTPRSTSAGLTRP